METVKYILGKPDYLDGIGDIYPVKVKDYDEFIKYSNVLYYNKNNFSKEAHEYPLLDLILFGVGGKNTDIKSSFIEGFENLFSLVLQQEVIYVENEMRYGFFIEEKKYISSHNYDILREIIMKQNLMHEPKVYKDPLVQQWAEKVLKARQKKGVNITIEDMITTVKNLTGVTYDVIAEQSLYQLHADFKRISKDKDYHFNISVKCAGADKVNIPHFAEEINMFENPYDSVFVGKDKLNGLNSAIQ